MKRSPKFIASLRWTLLALASLGTLLALALVVENWRGDRAWVAAERDLRARGEPVNWAELETPRVPDERNYFRQPLLAKTLFAAENDPERARSRNEPALRSLLDACNSVKATEDLAPLRAVFVKRQLVSGSAADPAADVLIALAPANPFLDALREAARERPQAWLPLKSPPMANTFDADLIFHLGRLLGLRARAQLASDRSDEAFADVHAVLRLADCLETTLPNLLQVLIGEALVGTAADVVREGCRGHRWSDAQLVALQNQLERMQPFVSLRQAFYTERTWSVYYLSIPPTRETRDYWPRWMVVRGWVQQNKVALLHTISDAITAFDVATGRIDMSRVARLSDADRNAKKSWSPYTWFARMFGGNFSGVAGSFGQGVNRHHQAILACALERHRLARGTYPTALGALTPEYIGQLPRDVFSGDPIRYAITPAGFTLTTFDSKGRDADPAWVQDKL